MIFQGVPPSGSLHGFKASVKLYQYLSKISKQHNSISNLTLFNVSIKGIEFIYLPNTCVFKVSSVISSIPTYFEKKESPIIFFLITINVFILLY